MELLDFKRLYSEEGYGSVVYKGHLRDVLDLAAKAFGAFKAENLAEFTGVSAGVISKARKGELPAETTVKKIINTALDACGFYLERSLHAELPRGWVAVPTSARACIAEVGELLDKVLLTTRDGNDKSDLVLGPMERAQLIAILETALSLLKCPLVEKSFLEKLRALLIRTSEKAAEKQLEWGLGAAATAAATALGALLMKHLP